MKLAFCLFKYFPYGGLQRDFMRIATMCVNAGHTVTVYTMEWQGLKPDHLSVKVLPKLGYSNHSNAIKFSQQVQKEVASEAFDLLIGFDKIAGLDVYYCADSCYVAKVHDQKAKYIKWLYCISNRYRTFSNLEETVFNSHAKTRVLYLSEQEQVKYQNAYNIDKSRGYLLPPNINKARFQPVTEGIKRQLKVALAKDLDLNSDDHWLLMVGSGFRTKGVDRSIRLMAHLLTKNLNVNLLIIGQDNNTQFMRMAKILKIDTQIKFLGAKENIADYMAVSSLLVHPAYRENTGTVILESIVMGLPVVASEVCGYSTYIKDSGCGEVIPEPFTQDSFNQIVYQLLTNPAVMTQQQKQGLKFREEADIYNADKTILRVIENA